MTEPGVPKLSFDPDEVIGRPRTLEFMPTRVRLGVRDGLVTTVELG